MKIKLPFLCKVWISLLSICPQTKEEIGSVHANSGEVRRDRSCSHTSCTYSSGSIPH